jgi:hypothetical protein
MSKRHLKQVNKAGEAIVTLLWRSKVKDRNAFKLILEFVYPTRDKLSKVLASLCSLLAPRGLEWWKYYGENSSILAEAFDRVLKPHNASDI